MSRLRDLGDRLARMTSQADTLVQRLRGERASAVLALVRPQLGHTPPALRRVAEPMVAAAAMLALGVLIGWAALSVGALVLAALIIALILKHVFGLELELDAPLPFD
ncbi:MAG: hypothetical protein AAB426_03935 [Myxococcota bacterium]